MIKSQLVVKSWELGQYAEASFLIDLYFFQFKQWRLPTVCKVLTESTWYFVSTLPWCFFWPSCSLVLPPKGESWSQSQKLSDQSFATVDFSSNNNVCLQTMAPTMEVSRNVQSVKVTSKESSCDPWHFSHLRLNNLSKVMVHHRPKQPKIQLS